MQRSSVYVTVSLAATLITPALAQNVISARPGTINYVEGQAALVSHTGSEDLKTRMEGVISLGAGESLTTTEGRAEVQLTPSIFLRVGQNSRVKMISPSLVHTVFAVERGRAEVEVDQMFEQNDLRVNVGSGPAATQTQLVKPGLYEFDADAGVVRVFEGRAEVSVGENAPKAISVKGGHLLALNGDAGKPQGFNKKKTADDLIEWGDLRSAYVGQENAGLAASGGGYGNGFYPGGYGFGSGGYPWFPGTGFYSPYGLGLYSSFYGGPFGFSGLGYPGFGYGFYGGPGYGIGGLGYGGYGGGYGYAASRPLSGLGVRGGYSGQFSNRGPARPGSGPVVGLHGATRSVSAGSASAGRSGASAPMASSGGGFHGGGGGGSVGAHSGGGGSHR